MKTLFNFLKHNQYWLNSIINEYVDNMEWDDGMKTHPSDYFTDTLFIARERLSELGIDNDEQLVFAIKSHIENETISRLRRKTNKSKN